MRMRAKAATCAAVIAAGATTAVAIGSDSEKYRTGLTGLEEVAAVITDGHGTFSARLNAAEDRIDFELSYSDLEGGEVRQAHIHAGQRTANGGIVAWLCDSAANTAPLGVNVDTCPTPSGTVTGTITPADVEAATDVPAQGFRADAEQVREAAARAARRRRVRERPHGDLAGRRDPRPDRGPAGQLTHRLRARPYGRARDRFKRPRRG